MTSSMRILHISETDYEGGAGRAREAGVTPRQVAEAAISSSRAEGEWKTGR